MNCDQFREILADLLADEISAGARLDAAAHARSCRRCAPMLIGLEAAQAGLRRHDVSLAEARAAADQVELPAFSAIAKGHDKRRTVPPVLRYAAVIALAFTAGYFARGSGTAPGEPNLSQTARLHPAGEADATTVNVLAGGDLAPSPQMIRKYREVSAALPASSDLSRCLVALARR